MLYDYVETKIPSKKVVQEVNEAYRFRKDSSPRPLFWKHFYNDD